MEAIEKKDIGKYRIEIFYDTSPESPRNWDNLGTMICFHNRYTLGDKDHGYDDDDYNGWEEMFKAIDKNENAAIILPIFMYDHSGITIATKPFGCRWDSGQIGFIFISKDKVRKEYNVKRISKKLLERVSTYLDGEVETYDQYLRGEIFGYQIHEITTCDKGHDHTEDLDSCWGYYSQEDCMTDAEGIVNHYLEIDKQPKDHTVTH